VRYDTQQARQEARRIGRLLGAGGAIFSLLAVFVMAASAEENQDSIVALQRSLVDLAQSGGADPLPLFARLLPMFVATYLAALLTCLASLSFSWYAGRVAAAATGQRRAGATAGFCVALVSGVVWAIAGALVIVVLRADGTLSWLLATVLYVLVSPTASASGGISTQAAPVYIGMELVLFLLHVVVGGGLALGLGTLAGSLGAAGSRASMPAVAGG
jgi:hypothetical protein